MSGTTVSSISWNGVLLGALTETLFAHGAGTPSASDKEKPDFMQYMTENTKVELVSRILQFMPLREALDNSQKEMVRGSSVGYLLYSYIERDLQCSLQQHNLEPSHRNV